MKFKNLYIIVFLFVIILLNVVKNNIIVKIVYIVEISIGIVNVILVIIIFFLIKDKVIKFKIGFIVCVINEWVVFNGLVYVDFWYESNV